jgi:glycine/D-amino acid oxidase-like deaminating enzyme
MRIVILGGGAIGASVAYFLAKRGMAPTVVERTALANAASGKSGGFLALDWCDGTPLQALARRSFALHAELGEAAGADWDFRRLDTFGGTVGGGGRRVHKSAWLGGPAILTQRLGGRETTAQVHPHKFTAAMMRIAMAKGATLRIGAVAGIERSGDRVSGAIVDGEVLSADSVVIAMGPWSALATDWLPLPPIYGLKGHSIIFDTGPKIPAEAVFLEAHDGISALSPEVFPRPDGTTWCCAVSSDAPLPADPSAVAPDPGAMERLEALCRKLSPALADAPIVKRQACFRPVTRDGLPLIGAIPSVESVYVATGHSVWGILNALATGEAIAELILDGATKHVDLAPFNPARLRAKR